MTADHGGHNRNHGDDVPEDMTIPVVLKGKRFPSGTELEAVSIKDIAPTILDVMGVPACPDWEGRSLLREKRTDSNDMRVRGGRAAHPHTGEERT